MAADTNFPHFSDGQSTEEKLYSMQSYLYMLLEELRYTLANVGKENFNEAAFSEISDEITGPVKKTIQSLDLEVTNGETSASIRLTGDGIEAEAKNIEFLGVVTFKSLLDGETVIDGGNIKTGTISGIEMRGNTFYCTLIRDGETSGRHEGEIILLHKEEGEKAYVAGGLRIDDEGEGGTWETRRRIILYAQNGVALKLDSTSNLSIEAGGLVYMAGAEAASIAAPKINLTGNVEITGSLTVNGQRIGGGTE